MIRRSCRDPIAIAAWMLRRIHLKQLAATILFLLLFPQLVFCAAIRIMPLGDSITYDNNIDDVTNPRPTGERTGYRQPLWLTLKAEGYDVDFVGSVVAGEDAVPDFDPDNEGHPGWRDDDIAANISDWLQNTPADIILLHIGTNGLDPDPNDVKNILDEIDRFSPDVWVVLARIINRQDHVCPDPSTTTTFNDNVENMALGRVNDRIVIVDMECGAGLDYRQDKTSPYVYDMYDTLHPNEAGYAKMADAWFQGLQLILPVAKAGGDQDVNPDDVVTLDGSSSTDALGTIVSYAWVQTGGSPTVTLTSVPSTPPAPPKKARFTAPDTSTGTALTFELTITDNRGFTHSDSCVVSVNGAPTADAGQDQRVKAEVSVVLDGSNSDDVDGSIVAYQWVQTAGLPVVTLANAGTSKASFSAPAVGSGGTALTFRLTVTDNKGATRSDTCVVNVNGPPVADAGTDQVANLGALVVLDGSKSNDADGSIASYQWVQTAGIPVGELANANTSQAGFTATAVGSGGEILSFRLTVADDLGVQSSDTVNVQINGPPVADAGTDQVANLGALVVLDGSQSIDADGSIVAYQWVQTAGTPVVELANANTAKASFSAPAVGSGGTALTFRLTVTDNRGVTKSDTIVVNVNGPPTADSGPDQQVQSGATVTLDGSGSADEEGGALAYSWMQISGPPVVLSNFNSSRPSFQAPSAGSTAVTLSFLLTVTDSGGLQSEDSCTVTVTPPGESSQSGSGGGGGGGGCFITAAGQ